MVTAKIIVGARQHNHDTYGANLIVREISCVCFDILTGQPQSYQFVTRFRTDLYTCSGNQPQLLAHPINMLTLYS